MANACIINDIPDFLGYCCDLGSSVKATPFPSVLGGVAGWLGVLQFTWFRNAVSTEGQKFKQPFSNNAWFASV